MILGRVVGTVVATRKDERLWARSSCSCAPSIPQGKDEAGYMVAVDTVDAGPQRPRAGGDRLLGAHGRRPQGLARWTPPSWAWSTASRSRSRMLLARVIGTVVAIPQGRGARRA